MIGNVAASDVSVVDDSTLVATTGAQAAGVYDVTITSRSDYPTDGGALPSSILPAAFTYMENGECPIPSADAGANDASSIKRQESSDQSSDESNANRVSGPIAALATDTANTDEASLPANGASGCAMTARTAAPLTPFALTLGALAMLRRKRRS